MNIFVDIDGTICHTEDGYPNAKPIEFAIHKINRLYEIGHQITYWTARGANTGIDWTELTKKQLSEWGCLYHKLRLDKPAFDCLLDDKAIKMSDVRLGEIGGISGIYKIESKKYPDKFYVGSANDISKRWNGHLFNLSKNKHHSSILQNHYNEFGKEDLKFSILEECNCEILIEKEREYLKKLNPCFNIYKEPGSPKNHKFSDKARKNMSDAHMGKTQSEKTKRKRSLSMMEHSVSQETINKIIEKRKNYKHSQVTKDKLSITSTGNTNGCGKHKISQEAREKMSDAGTKTIGILKRNYKGQFIKRIEEI
jgi:group I intron endonuclease